MYLNFGRTIGHAAEQTAGYGKVMHGEAVAMEWFRFLRVVEEKCLMPLRGIATSNIAGDVVTRFASGRRAMALRSSIQPSHYEKSRGTVLKTEVIVPEIGTASQSNSF